MNSISTDQFLNGYVKSLRGAFSRNLVRHLRSDQCTRTLCLVLVISMLLSLLGVPYSVYASENVINQPKPIEIQTKNNHPTVVQGMKELHKVFPGAIEGSLPENKLDGLSSPLQAPPGRQLSCAYLGGGTNQCSPTPSTFLHHDFQIQGSGFGAIFPREDVKVICSGYGCTQVPVYYSLSCSVTWTANFSVTLSNYAEIDDDTIGDTPVESDSVSCGSGTSGSCSLSLRGRYPPEKIPPDPNKTWHLYAF